MKTLKSKCFLFAIMMFLSAGLLTGCGSDSDASKDFEVEKEVIEKEEAEETEDVPEDASHNENADEALREEESRIVTTQWITILNDNVNVRNHPSTDETSSVIAKGMTGEEYPYIADNGEWCQITYNNQDAFIKLEFV